MFFCIYIFLLHFFGDKHSLTHRKRNLNWEEHNIYSYSFSLPKLSSLFWRDMMRTQTFILAKRMGRLKLGQPNLKSQLHSSPTLGCAPHYDKGVSNDLPKLPVPPLAETVQKFTEFSKLVLREKDFQETLNVSNEFLQNSQVQHLQQSLEKRSKNLSNWLTPWWLNVAYLEARTPLPIVTSPGITFPRFNFSGVTGQVECAAKFIHSVLKYHHVILDGELAPDKAGGALLDMSQYQNLVGTTRVPNVSKDEIRYGRDQKEWARHIIVVRNGHSFHVPVYTDSGENLNVEEIQTQLHRILVESESVNEFPINVCSSDERDAWATVYNRLKNSSLSSTQSYENALFVVALDRCADDVLNPPNDSENMKQAIHGGGTHHNTINRWFDKTLQFYINTNGYAGLTYEHTPAEGPPLAMLLDFVLDQFDKNAFPTSSTGKSKRVSPPKKLCFELTEDDKKAIVTSAEKINRAAQNLEVVSLTFDHYGKNVPKAAHLSPDSYIQLALQLAFYQIHGFSPPTYETGTLRKFKEGRTDTIRLPNAASAEFVALAAESPNHHELGDLLQKAIASHKHYSNLVMNGKGIDRHLLGLKLTALEMDIPLPKLFTTPAYQRLFQFELSTSQVPTRHDLPMGFGPATSTGYAVCYNPQESKFLFSITAFESCVETSAKRFSRQLTTSLLHIKDIVDKAGMLVPISKI
uniref:Choline/carnitine acyltransferase domain-containing protein n=1 Tax=Ditylenchus dipsaci TaxID=166011 RepID=A0A915E0D7_9BILA